MVEKFLVEKFLVEISCNLLTVLMAFAFTFHLLLPSNEAFDDPMTALLKVLAMMVGEFDFQENFLSAFAFVMAVFSNDPIKVY